jgi:hypothetical protein
MKKERCQIFGTYEKRPTREIHNKQRILNTLIVEHAKENLNRSHLKGRIELELNGLSTHKKDNMKVDLFE